MKSQNSEIYFICYSAYSHNYWYGMHDSIASRFSWSDSVKDLRILDFTFTKLSELSHTTFEELSSEFPIICQQSTPFDLAYLQTNYPEHLI